MDSNTSTFKSLLRAASRSLTAPRLAVFRALAGHQPMTMRELVAKTGGIDRASVYRAVELFERLGIVQRVTTGWKYKLELTDAFHDHHHHLTCTNCGATTDMNEAELEQVISRLAESHNFKPTAHQIEIQGLCQNCSAGQAKPVLEHP